jgi:hypothetical protein
MTHVRNNQFLTFDDKLARRGLLAFQVHSGGPMEVRFKEIKLEYLPPK